MLRKLQQQNFELKNLMFDVSLHNWAMEQRPEALSKFSVSDHSIMIEKKPNPNIVRTLATMVLASTVVTCLCSMLKNRVYLPFAQVGLVSIVLYTFFTFIVSALNRLDSAYVFADGLMPLIALPFTTTEIWLKHHHLYKTAPYLPASVGALFTLLTLVSCMNQQFAHLSVFFSGVTLFTVGSYGRCYEAMAAAVCYLVGHFGASLFGSRGYKKVRMHDMFDFFLASFVYLSYRALVRA